MLKNWFCHNMFGHPAMQILNMLGLRNLAKKAHDGTLPRGDGR